MKSSEKIKKQGRKRFSWPVLIILVLALLALAFTRTSRLVRRLDDPGGRPGSVVGKGTGEKLEDLKALMEREGWLPREIAEKTAPLRRMTPEEMAEAIEKIRSDIESGASF